jgi:NDP-sugar pyrophosphorylase family protein
MESDLKEIEYVVENEDNIDKIPELLNTFLKTHLKRSKIDKYIGDYPTFIEPVYLEDNVKIGDDVLLGPNTYIGANSIIGDYAEISNTVIFDNVKIGDNFKLDKCIIGRNSDLNFANFSANNSIIKGSGNSKENLKITKFS